MATSGWLTCSGCGIFKPSYELVPCERHVDGAPIDYCKNCVDVFGFRTVVIGRPEGDAAGRAYDKKVSGTAGHGMVEAVNAVIANEMAKGESTVASKPKVQISVREVKWLNERKRQINMLDIDDIEWITEDGRVIPYNEKNVEDFKFTGLSNIDFIELGFHDGSVVIESDDDPWDSGLGKQIQAEDAL